MIRFSANLGFLWPELELPEAIRAAKRAGFDAVECHWPYSFEPLLIANVLAETGHSMLNINTVRGNIAAGEFGTAALPGRESETKEAIDQAIAYSTRIGKPDIHVLPGITNSTAAWDVFLGNLDYACKEAAAHDITILIEPVNTIDLSGYFLNHTEQAAALIETLGAENLKLMFDCYHVHLMEGDVMARMEAMWPYIRHVQFSSAPGRGRPDCGLINFSEIFGRLVELGHSRPLGAEYRPEGVTEDSLGWLSAYRRIGEMRPGH